MVSHAVAEFAHLPLERQHFRASAAVLQGIPVAFRRTALPRLRIDRFVRRETLSVAGIAVDRTIVRFVRREILSRPVPGQSTKDRRARIGPRQRRGGAAAAVLERTAVAARRTPPPDFGRCLAANRCSIGLVHGPHYAADSANEKKSGRSNFIAMKLRRSFDPYTDQNGNKRDH